MLRKLRALRGLSGSELARVALLSQPTISKIECGKYSRLTEKHFESLMVALDPTPEELQELRLQYAATRLSAESYRFMDRHGLEAKQLEILEIESVAQRVRVFESVMIPGLLQLPDYTRAALLELGVPSRQIESAVNARIRRQDLLSRARTQYSFVIAETALYSMPCSREITAMQLDRLSRYCGGSSNVSIRILPAFGGYPIGAANSFTVIDRSYVTAETVISEQQVREPADIVKYLDVFDSLESASVGAPRAQELLARATASLPVLDS